MSDNLAPDIVKAEGGGKGEQRCEGWKAYTYAYVFVYNIHTNR